MMSIHEEQERERQLAEELRVRARSVIQHSSLEDVAEKLGVLPRSVEKLLWTPFWTLTEAFRICELLELPVVELLVECAKGETKDD